VFSDSGQMITQNITNKPSNHLFCLFIWRL